MSAYNTRLTHRINRRALYNALNVRRAVRQMTWTEVAEETGISPSTFPRLREGRGSLYGDALVSALTWLGMAEEFGHLIAPPVGDGEGNDPKIVDDTEILLLAERIEEVLRTVPVRLGTNAFAMMGRGEPVTLSGGEYASMALAVACALSEKQP